MSKAGKAELVWLNRNGGKLEKLAGRWIAVPGKGEPFCSAPTLTEVLSKSRTAKPGEAPFVFRIPRREETQRVEPVRHPVRLSRSGRA